MSGRSNYSHVLELTVRIHVAMLEYRRCWRRLVAASLQAQLVKRLVALWKHEAKGCLEWCDERWRNLWLQSRVHGTVRPTYGALPPADKFSEGRKRVVWG